MCHVYIQSDTGTVNSKRIKCVFRHSMKYGMFEILPYASSGIELTTDQCVEAQFVPDVYHKLSLYRTCQALLEQLDATSGGTTSKELEVMIKKVQMVETILMHKVGVQLSSQTRYYDGIYGVNRKKLIQDFDRNAYIGGCKYQFLQWRRR